MSTCYSFEITIIVFWGIKSMITESDNELSIHPTEQDVRAGCHLVAGCWCQQPTHLHQYDESENQQPPHFYHWGSRQQLCGDLNQRSAVWLPTTSLSMFNGFSLWRIMFQTWRFSTNNWRRRDADNSHWSNLFFHAFSRWSHVSGVHATGCGCRLAKWFTFAPTWRYQTLNHYYRIHQTKISIMSAVALTMARVRALGLRLDAGAGGTKCLSAFTNSRWNETTTDNA